MKDGKPQYIQTSNSKTLKIDDIKSLIDKNEKQFLAIVVNNDFTTEDYLGQSNIDLTVKVTPKTTISDFDLTYTKCNATIAIYARFRGRNMDGSTENKTE